MLFQFKYSKKKDEFQVEYTDENGEKHLKTARSIQCKTNIYSSRKGKFSLMSRVFLGGNAKEIIYDKSTDSITII